MWPNGKPSEQLFAVLSGSVSMDDADPAIRSVAQKPIHDAAVMLIRIEDKTKRLATLQKIPEEMRPYVEKRVAELWDLRYELRGR
jgi:hypothetical protein